MTSTSDGVIIQTTRVSSVVICCNRGIVQLYNKKDKELGSNGEVRKMVKCPGRLRLLEDEERMPKKMQQEGKSS